MATAYIGLGSNLQDPVQQITLALTRLQQLPHSQFLKASSLYQSAPVGFLPQPDFINAVAALETQLTPHQLLEQLQQLESRQGRTRNGERNQPRNLDLDVLLYDQLILQSPPLTIPHPRLTQRAFVLIPLHEIAPDLSIPLYGTLQQLLTHLPDSTDSIKLLSALI